VEQKAQIFSHDYIINAKNGRYLIRTFNDAHQSNIVSRLFRDGQTISERIMNYDKNLPSEKVAELTYRLHLRHRNEVEAIFSVIDNKISLAWEEMLLLVRSLISKKYYREAIKILERLMNEKKADKQRHIIYFCLGKCHFYNGDFEKAEAFFSSAVRTKPEYADYQNFYGESLLQNKKIGDAHIAFQSALKCNPYYARAHYNAGLVYLLNYIEKADYRLAKEFPYNCESSLDKAVQLLPIFGSSDYILGRGYLRQKEFSKAYKLLLSARNVNMTSELEQTIYDFYLNVLFDKDISIDGIWSLIEELRVRQKEYPSYPDVLNHLGVAYMILAKAMSNYAINQFRKAIQINPSYKSARKNLKLVESDYVGYDLLLKAIAK